MRGIIPSYNLLAVQPFIQPRVLLTIFTARTHCWLTCSLLSATLPRLFSAELLPRKLITRLSLQGLFFPSLGLCVCPALLNCVRFLLAHSSRLSGFTLMAALSSSILAGHSNLVSSGNLMRVHSAASSRSLRKMRNSSGPRINCYDTPLVTGLQAAYDPLTSALQA